MAPKSVAFGTALPSRTHFHFGGHPPKRAHCGSQHTRSDARRRATSVLPLTPAWCGIFLPVCGGRSAESRLFDLNSFSGLLLPRQHSAHLPCARSAGLGRSCPVPGRGVRSPRGADVRGFPARAAAWIFSRVGAADQCFAHVPSPVFFES